MTELDELLAFAANAFASAARTRQRNGLPVPPLALTIARWCADTARSGTARQPLADLTEAGDRGPMERPLLLTIPAAAVLLSVSERTIRNMCADGRLTPVKIGGATRIRRGDVDALVAARPASPRFMDRVEQKTADDESSTTDAPETPAPAAGKSPASVLVEPSCSRPASVTGSAA